METQKVTMFRQIRHERTLLHWYCAQQCIVCALGWLKFICTGLHLSFSLSARAESTYKMPHRIFPIVWNAVFCAEDLLAFCVCILCSGLFSNTRSRSPFCFTQMTCVAFEFGVAEIGKAHHRAVSVWRRAGEVFRAAQMVFDQTGNHSCFLLSSSTVFSHQVPRLHRLPLHSSRKFDSTRINRRMFSACCFAWILHVFQIQGLDPEMSSCWTSGFLNL